MTVTVRMLGEEEAATLQHVDATVFDGPVRSALAQEFLRDPRHHIAVAVLPEGPVVGMASALHYVHPDKPNQMFITEVGVADDYLRQGIGRRLVLALLAHARSLRCYEAWVATEVDNAAARALYVSTGGAEDDDRAVVYTYDLT